MPTTIIAGYRFRFYSSDRSEPPHMHVLCGGNEAKIWLDPVELEYNHGYNRSELSRILKLTQLNLARCWRRGMRTLTSKRVKPVRATGVRFAGDILFVPLSDGREVALNLKRVAWLRWLLKATPAQRSAWSIEPRGFAIYWNELDDGIEVCHVLGTQPIA